MLEVEPYTDRPHLREFQIKLVKDRSGLQVEKPRDQYFMPDLVRWTTLYGYCITDPSDAGMPLDAGARGQTRGPASHRLEQLHGVL